MRMSPWLTLAILIGTIWFLRLGVRRLIDYADGKFEIPKRKDEGDTEYRL